MAPHQSQAGPPRFQSEPEALPCLTPSDHGSLATYLGAAAVAFGFISSTALATAFPGRDNVRQFPTHRSQPRRTSSGRRSGVFVSFSAEKDGRYERLLFTHLAPLRKKGVVYFSSAEIPAGSRWKRDTARALGSSRVAVLLVSPHYLASDEIMTGELPDLLRAAERDQTTIMSLIIDHCAFSRMKELAGYHPVNPPSKPLAKMRPAKQQEYLWRLTEQIWTIFAQDGLILP
jgi:TIR domain